MHTQRPYRVASHVVAVVVRVQDVREPVAFLAQRTVHGGRLRSAGGVSAAQEHNWGLPQDVGAARASGVSTQAVAPVASSCSRYP